MDYFSAAPAVTALAQMTKDASASTETPGASWIAVGGKSSKECTLISAAIVPNNFVSCTKVNAHFYRDFETDSATED